MWLVIISQYHNTQYLRDSSPVRNKSQKLAVAVVIYCAVCLSFLPSRYFPVSISEDSILEIKYQEIGNVMKTLNFLSDLWPPDLIHKTKRGKFVWWEWLFLGSCAVLSFSSWKLFLSSFLEEMFFVNLLYHHSVLPVLVVCDQWKERCILFRLFGRKVVFWNYSMFVLYAKSYCSIVTSQHNHVNKLSLWINEGECFINNNDKNGNGFPFRSCSWQLTQGGTDMKSVRLQAASR